jgi:hypothetical protein
MIVFCAQAQEAQRLLEEIPVFAPQLKTRLLPDWEILPYDHFSPHQDLISERLATLYEMLAGTCDIVLVPVTTALQRLGPPEFLSGHTFFFRQGDRLNESALRLQLQQAELAIDLSLARGLNYYTGTILEVKARDFAYGSIGGGGRYDDLTGIFGLPGVPGVGISFGADRIYDILNELNLFPNEALNTSEVLIANFSAEELTPCLYLVQELRTASIPAEIFPEAGKLKKQFDYAEKKGIPFLMIYGATEAEGGIVNVKELSSGRQVTVPRAEISSFRSYFNL